MLFNENIVIGEISISLSIEESEMYIFLWLFNLPYLLTPSLILLFLVIGIDPPKWFDAPILLKNNFFIFKTLFCLLNFFISVLNWDMLNLKFGFPSIVNLLDFFEIFIFPE